MILVRWRIWALATAISVAAVVVVLSAADAAATSSGAGGPKLPDQIASASLSQDGQLLAWQVQLEEPWAANRLARQHRSLCLLIERVASGVVWGEACVTGPGHGSREPRLAYMKVFDGRAGSSNLIPATVTRASSSELTATFLPSAVDLRYGPIRWQTISTEGSDSCGDASAARGCSVRYPAKPRLLALHTPVLVGCVPGGPSLVYQGPSGRREIALTFDDGPWNDPPTTEFLAVLEREHVPATFFEIGKQISTYDPGGKLERRMLADGDMIGDHTWTHPANLVSLSAARQRQELLRTATAIRSATDGFMPCLWRPPYGATSKRLVALARSLGFLTILWDVDPRDWALPGVGAIYSNVVRNAHDGAIVIQHFGGGPRFQTLAALPQEIAMLRREGYQFVTVTQLLGLKLVYR